jgi:hypothetical protein
MLLDSMIVLSDAAKRRRTLRIASFNASAGVRDQNAGQAPDVRNLPESVDGDDPFSSEIAIGCFGSEQRQASSSREQMPSPY